MTANSVLFETTKPVLLSDTELFLMILACTVDVSANVAVLNPRSSTDEPVNRWIVTFSFNNDVVKFGTYLF